jgi:hypothetical protein
MYSKKYGKITDINKIFIKDVLEHVNELKMLDLLLGLKKTGAEIFVIVPLGDCGRYRIAEYEQDITHVIKQDECWWINMFVSAGFKIDNFRYDYHGLKQNWIDKNPHGNGFFFLS